VSGSLGTSADLPNRVCYRTSDGNLVFNDGVVSDTFQTLGAGELFCYCDGCQAADSGSGSEDICDQEHSGDPDYHCACVDGSGCQQHPDVCAADGHQTVIDRFSIFDSISSQLDNGHVRSRLETAFHDLAVVCKCIANPTISTENDGAPYKYPNCIREDGCNVAEAWKDVCSGGASSCTSNPEQIDTADCPVSVDLTECPQTGAAQSVNNNCVIYCDATGARDWYMPYASVLNNNTCGCEWSDTMKGNDRDGDKVPDCHDMCGRKGDIYNNTDDSPPINAPLYSHDDKNASNTGDDDGDGFPNCIDFCPQHKNSDPTNATSPCVRRVEPAGEALMPGPDGSSSTTTKMLGAAVPVVAVLGVF